MERVTVYGAIGDNRVERVGFCAATRTGPVIVMRAVDILDLEIDPDGRVGEADARRVEAGLASALAGEIRAVEQGADDVEANRRASAEQLVLSP